LSGVTQVTGSATGAGSQTAQAVCATGSTATGGGFEVSGTDNTKYAVYVSKPTVIASGPDAGKSAWTVTATYTGNGNGPPYTLTAYVFCALTS
jgi:hypothetical protein